MTAEPGESLSFRPRFPWYGGDLQTLRNYLARGNRQLTDWPAERLYFAAPDGSGDRLQAVLHRLPDAPVVVLVHGLTGCEGSFYVLETAHNLLAAGYSVLRLNLRGAGPSRETCGGHYSAASTADLDAVLRQLPDQLVEHGVGIVGFSLGGSIVLKHLSERTRAEMLRCAVVISAPLDLNSAAIRMTAPRNRIYHRWLLNRMRVESTAFGASISSAERSAIASARSVIEFDDRFVAPRNGFTGAQDYYDRCSAGGRLSEIDCPVLVIHAADDPWIPADPFRTSAGEESSTVSIVLTKTGGHVGFHGKGSTVPWHDSRILAFIREQIGRQV